MRYMNINPILAYNRQGSAKALLIFLLVMALLIMVIPLVFYVAGSTESVGSVGYTGPAFIFALVAGIINIREDLRLGIQFGVGRPTVALASALEMCFGSLILALSGEVLLLVLGNTANSWMSYTDFFQQLYTKGAPLTVIQHFTAIILTFLMYTSAWASGALISMTFWRVNTKGTLVIAIGFPVMFLVALDEVADRIPWVSNGGFEGWLVETPGHLMEVFFVLTLFSSCITWLLVRRTAIKANK